MTVNYDLAKLPDRVLTTFISGLLVEVWADFDKALLSALTAEETRRRTSGAAVALRLLHMDLAQLQQAIRRCVRLHGDIEFASSQSTNHSWAFELVEGATFIARILQTMEQAARELAFVKGSPPPSNAIKDLQS